MENTPLQPGSVTTARTVLHEAAREIPVTHETEVLVVGGGSAGAAAAIAAARAGADTLLVERYGYLGGLATGGLIVLLLTLDEGRGQQVVSGICQKVTERLVAAGAAYHPPAGEWGSDDPALVDRDRRWGLVWGRAPHRVRYSVAYEAAALKGVLDTLVCDSGARLLLHAWGCEPILEEEQVEGRIQGRVEGPEEERGNARVAAVAFQGKAGRFAVRARVVVDATGDGDLVRAAGCAHELEEVLPWMWFTAGGVDVERAQAAGAGCFRTVGPGKVLLPWGSVPKVARVDATRPESLTRAEVELRARVLAEFARLRREVPGFEGAHLCQVAEQLGITESARLVGRRVLRREDMDAPLPDAVAVTGHWTKYGATYAIPYGCLLPRELSNLLVAGRCISVDHRVHHATKEIPACMATGQAAGTAAALAVRAGIEPADLDVAALRRALEEAGAIVALPPAA